VRLSMQCQAGL